MCSSDLVSPATVAHLARVLKPGARFLFATDVKDYVHCTLAHMAGSNAFERPPGGPSDWQRPFSGWHTTRYEKKARRQGRQNSHYLTFVRRHTC